MVQRFALALALLDLVGCPEPEKPDPSDPRETLEACGLPEPCEVAAAYDACLAGGFDEAPVRCVLGALSGTGPVHVSVYRTTICGDISDYTAVDIFRWEDGTATCVFWYASDDIRVRACDGLPVAECRDIDADAPFPEICDDWRNWFLQSDGEAEAICR